MSSLNQQLQRIRDYMKQFIPITMVITMGITPAIAQIYDPAPVDVTDGFAFIPDVESVVRYDDNIYRDESNKTSSSIFLVTPSIKFGTDDGVNQYGGTYQLTSASYSESSNNNYVDHRLKLLAHTEYTSKHRTDFSLGFNNLHEDKGDGLSESIDPSTFSEVIKYNESTARGYYQYGGLTSLMRIGGGVAYNNKSFQNYSDFTKYNDYASLKYFADSDYQVGDVTYLTVDVASTDTTYKDLKVNNESRDSRDNRALIGVKWEGLSKTTGIFKAGYQHKSFDSNRKSFSGSTFDLGIVWQALQHSSFTAHAIRSAEDSDNVGDYIEELTASLGWKHDWSEKFNSNLQAIYIDENYIGATREDDTTRATIDFNYDFTRWLRMTAGYEFSTKNSTAKDISYDKNVVNLGVSISL